MVNQLSKERSLLAAARTLERKIGARRRVQRDEGAVSTVPSYSLQSLGVKN